MGRLATTSVDTRRRSGRGRAAAAARDSPDA